MELFLQIYKIVSYPTRLAAAWKADILEINIPAYEINRNEIEIKIEKGSTESLNIRSQRIWKRIYKKITKPIDLGDQYILDTRYETDKNIAHIIKNISPGLLAAQKIPPEIPHITVILKANASAMAKTAYKLLGFSVLCTDKNVMGTIIKAPTGRFGEYECHYDQLFGKLTFEGYKENTPKGFLFREKDQEV